MFVELIVRVAAKIPDNVDYENVYIDAHVPIAIMLNGDEVGEAFEYETMSVERVRDERNSSND
jgi:hypothetical protein